MGEYHIIESRPDGLNIEFPIIHVDTFEEAFEVISKFDLLKNKETRNGK